jgi:hypothetical protein
VRKIRIATGAGFASDRIEPGVELVQKGDIDYLIYECLAERTIAIAQKEKLKDSNLGYNSLLEVRLNAVIDECVEKKIKIITNMGAANPLGALKKTKEVLKNKGITGVKVGVVLGDDIYQDVINSELNTQLLETDEPLDNIKEHVISANAYIGAGGIISALDQGADIVITGRVADPCLYLAPLVHEFGWSMDNYNMLGKGISIGHLLECGPLVTGGLFADPGYKDVPGIARLGYPIAEVYENGDAIITKVPGSGGIVDLRTCKEQLVYEIHNPKLYYTPDVTADFSEIEFKEVGIDQVLVTGGKGTEKPEMYKVSLGYMDGFIGEGQISYAGDGALKRAELAKEVIQERFKIIGLKSIETRFDFIGFNSVHGNTISDLNTVPYEVRFRVAARTNDYKEAKKVGEEIEGLYRGPFGGGGATKNIEEVLTISSILLPRNFVSVESVIESV